MARKVTFEFGWTVDELDELLWALDWWMCTWLDRHILLIEFENEVMVLTEDPGCITPEIKKIIKDFA